MYFQLRSPPRICDYLQKYTQKQNDKIIEGVKPKEKYKLENNKIRFKIK